MPPEVGCHTFTDIVIGKETGSDISAMTTSSTSSSSDDDDSDKSRETRQALKEKLASQAEEMKKLQEKLAMAGKSSGSCKKKKLRDADKFVLRLFVVKKTWRVMKFADKNTLEDSEHIMKAAAVELGKKKQDEWMPYQDAIKRVLSDATSKKRGNCKSTIRRKYRGKQENDRGGCCSVRP